MIKILTAYRILSEAKLTWLAYVTPVLLIASDVTGGSQDQIWHDLFQIAVTAIGVVIIFLVKTYLSGLKRVAKEIEDLRVMRDEDNAKTRLAFAGEVDMLKRRQDNAVQIITQLLYQVYGENVTARTEAIRELNKGE